MSDWLTRQRKGRRSGVDWLRLDSWIDSSLSNTWEGFQDRWNAASSFFARFRLSGWRRGATELMSEGLTLMAGGLVLMYGLALPAFQEMDEGKLLSTGKFAVKFLDREGNEIGQRGILHNDAVPLEEIPDHLIKATLATEDRRFFEHFGIDLLGTARAFFENVRAGETVQGGSTLTQQLAKNLFLSFERSFDRKLKELFLAFWLESRFTKQQILKLYFDRAYMGGGAFGVEAASQFYFGKSVREITLAESAMLAGLFKAPAKFAPHLDLPASRARANLVLTNLVDAGFMTAGQVHGARLNPARSIETRSTYSPDWYLDWAFEEIQRIAEGRGHYVLTARTTIDVRLQQAADQALVSTIRQDGRERNASSGALVAMEPDGAVRALVGGVDYGESQFNRVSAARRQPGSSFKLYVYANALDHSDLTATSIVRDAAPPCGNWAPKNYDGGSGSGARITMTSAFARSLNTTAVDLSFKYERDNVLEMTRRLGVKGVRKTCSMALGDHGITPLEHTAAYAVFANNGRAVKPYAILEIMNSRGDVIYTREKDEPPAPRIVDERVVVNMNRMMHAVVTEGTGRRAALEGTHVVGKTGTSSSYRDAWFLGFTGQYVTGVWIGNDDFRPMSNVTGGNLPAMTWQKFMSVATSSLDIPTIPGLEPHPAQIEERRRLAALRELQPGGDGPAAGAALPPNAMPDRTRQALRQLGNELRLAVERPGGIGNGQPDGVAPAPASGTRKPAPATGKRAEAPPLGETAGAAPPPIRPASVQRR